MPALDIVRPRRLNAGSITVLSGATAPLVRGSVVFLARTRI